MGGEKTNGGSPLNNAQLSARRDAAIKMRMRRHTFQEIAEELGYSNRSGAYRDIKQGIGKMEAETSKMALRAELDSLDELERVYIEAALDGNMEALDRVLKIKDRRSKYLGLEAPKEINANMNAPITVAFNSALAAKVNAEPELEVDG